MRRQRDDIHADEPGLADEIPADVCTMVVHNQQHAPLLAGAHIVHKVCEPLHEERRVDPSILTDRSD